MAMNPMQRKANNYLLIGVLVTLLITGTIIVILFMQLNKLQQDKKKEETAVKTAYVLSTNVKSGEEITFDKVVSKQVSTNVVSADTTVQFSETPSGDETAEEASKKVKRVAKIDLAAGTIITNDMITDSDQVTTNDLRNQEYNMVILPSTIENGDYIDVRLRLTNGTDFIVVSKKQVEIPQVDGIDSTDVMKIQMNELEIKTMAGAIVEAYIDEGAMLYATTYVEPGLQTSSIPTYVPSAEVQNAIASDTNVLYEARKALIDRYDAAKNVRLSLIENNLNRYDAKDKVDNIEAKVQEEITKAKQARESYLQSLGGY